MFEAAIGLFRPGRKHSAVCEGPDPTFKDPTPDGDPVSDPATLVSVSRELRGKLALYS